MMNIYEIIILKLYVVVVIARCCWVHAYSYKVGSSCPVHSNTLFLGVYTPALTLRSYLLQLAFRSLLLQRWLVPHAYCIVELLLRCCIVVNVELLLVVVVFQMLSRNKWSICEILLMNSICELLLLFKLLNSVDELYAYYYWMWNLTPSVWMLPLRG